MVRVGKRDEANLFGDWKDGLIYLYLRKMKNKHKAIYDYISIVRYIFWEKNYLGKNKMRKRTFIYGKAGNRRKNKD